MPLIGQFDRSALILLPKCLEVTILGEQGVTLMSSRSPLALNLGFVSPSHLPPRTPFAAHGANSDLDSAVSSRTHHMPMYLHMHSHVPLTCGICVFIDFYGVTGGRERMPGHRLLPAYRNRLPFSGHINYISQLPLR